MRFAFMACCSRLPTNPAHRGGREPAFFRHRRSSAMVRRQPADWSFVLDHFYREQDAADSRNACDDASRCARCRRHGRGNSELCWREMVSGATSDSSSAKICCLAAAFRPPQRRKQRRIAGAIISYAAMFVQESGSRRADRRLRADVYSRCEQFRCRFENGDLCPRRRTDSDAMAHKRAPTGYFLAGVCSF